MQFLILANDATDEGALERRMSVRQQHLDALKPLVDAGRVEIGGVILDDEGTIRGSMLVVEAEDEASVRALVEQDIYVRENVWGDVQIRPFRRSV